MAPTPRGPDRCTSRDHLRAVALAMLLVIGASISQSGRVATSTRAQLHTAGLRSTDPSVRRQSCTALHRMDGAAYADAVATDLRKRLDERKPWDLPAILVARPKRRLVQLPRVAPFPAQSWWEWEANSWILGRDLSVGAPDLLSEGEGGDEWCLVLAFGQSVGKGVELHLEASYPVLRDGDASVDSRLVASIVTRLLNR